MLIFLYGRDSYRRIQKLNEVIDTYRKKYSGLSHERFDLDNDDDFLKLQSFVRNRSIFDPVRLAVIDGLDEKIKGILKAYRQAKDLVIIINSDKKPAAAFSALLKPPTQIQDFPALKGAEINSFIKETAKSLGFTIGASTVKALIQTFGSNTWGIATELERMVLVSDGDKTISIHRPADNFFQLINTVKYGRRLEERLIALELLLSDRKDEPAKIFNLLAYRLRSEEEANLLADYDVAIKSGKLEYEEVLLDYALS